MAYFAVWAPATGQTEAQAQRVSGWVASMAAQRWCELHRRDESKVRLHVKELNSDEPVQIFDVTGHIHFSAKRCP